MVVFGIDGQYGKYDCFTAGVTDPLTVLAEIKFSNIT